MLMDAGPSTYILRMARSSTRVIQKLVDILNGGLQGVAQEEAQLPLQQIYAMRTCFHHFFPPSSEYV